MHSRYIPFIKQSFLVSDTLSQRDASVMNPSDAVCFVLWLFSLTAAFLLGTWFVAQPISYSDFEEFVLAPAGDRLHADPACKHLKRVNRARRLKRCKDCGYR